MIAAIVIAGVIVSAVVVYGYAVNLYREESNASE